MTGKPDTQENDYKLHLAPVFRPGLTGSETGALLSRRFVHKVFAGFLFSFQVGPDLKGGVITFYNVDFQSFRTPPHKPAST